MAHDSQQRYDVDLFVIGAGSGGVRAARFAAQAGARVAIAERGRLGGTCVNVGCIPKKLLVNAAHFGESFRDAVGYGWEAVDPGFDWARLIAAKDREIERLNGVYGRLLEGSGVAIHRGHAELVDDHTVAINGRHFTAANILLAVGGKPWVPEFPGRELVLTSDDMFALPQLPRRIAVVGGGYIGVEFAGICHGLGSRTTLLYRGELFLRGFDRELRERLATAMRRKGIDLRFNCGVAAVRQCSDGLVVTQDDGSELYVDAVLYATGRRPCSEGLGLARAGVGTDDRGRIIVDDDYRTSVPHIFAIGDVIDGPALTPSALAQGMAVAQRLFGAAATIPSLDLIPTAIFSQPPLATVGLNEEQARQRCSEISVFTSEFTPLLHTLTGRGERCFLKLVVERRGDRVVGAHMLGAEAAEIIQGVAIAMQAGATKRDFDTTLGIHPSVAEEFVTMRTPVR
jgi:glutathione reductase (NADPH)